MASRLRLSVRETRVVLQQVQGPLKPAQTPSKKPRAKRPEFGAGLPVLLACEAGELLRVRLPIRLTNNNGGRSGTYHASATFRKKCEERLRAWGLASHVLAPWLPVGSVRFACPVRVRVVRILGPYERRWDTSSLLRGNYKEIEDALVAIGWFPNDSPEWIVETVPDQDDSQRDVGPSIVIEVRAAE